MKMKACAALISAIAVVSASHVVAYEASRGPTELIYWDPQKASPGYTFVKPQRVRGMYLIDMAGQVVNYWAEFSDAYLLEDGTMFGAKGSDTFAQADWDGNILWEHTETRIGYDPHHDFLRIYNSELEDYTVLYIANAPLTHDEVIALGADPGLAASYDGAQMDTIVEVDRNGDVIWEWRFRDHLVQDIDATKNNYVGRGQTIADFPQRLDINWGAVSADYLHCNGLDYNPELGQIAISSNRTHEIYIIDHDETFVAGDAEKSVSLAASEAGDFLYRFGNPANYGQGEYPYYAKKNWSSLEYSGHKQIGGNHDIQWIKEGLPGAGHLLLFNNGLTVPRSQGDSDPQSEFLELNPYLDGEGVDQGHYVNPPKAGYVSAMPGSNNPLGASQPRVTRLHSRQIVAGYQTTDGFNSHHGSAVQRMPNGNTLVQLARVGADVRNHSTRRGRMGVCESRDVGQRNRDDPDYFGT